ncbi:hypothetical protein BDW02DRAFT_651490 [Decorospora gaudefroyi]|uniref:Dienelactone hydrolase domain-containing protein n=1 Tax=Decorospora gaudefroyi TaxID=184978 RepID=A0A6A5JZN7_9PLEO|nr:hypothetical protein BDW02DRAFT_651490 [Decorospora gaudefroyi]
MTIIGTIHAGLPQGAEEVIHGLNTYVVGNRSNPRGIIVVYSDIFGLALPNNKLIADAYAKSGNWLVYLPDFFQGDPVSLTLADLLIPADDSKLTTFTKYTGLLASAPHFLLWMSRHFEGPTNKVCMDFLTALRQATPLQQKIGMAGFCWGGKYAIRAGLERNMIDMEGQKVPLVNAVAALHPSHLAVPDDVETLVVPATFGWGVEDIAVSYNQKAMVEEVHAEARERGRHVPEIAHQTYRPGRHGFAVRGNPDDPLERACLEDSHKQVNEWFDRWL